MYFSHISLENQSCSYVYIPLQQAFILLSQTFHLNMTSSQSNEILLHTASASYIMDGLCTQHLSPALLPPLSASFLSSLQCEL